MKYTEERLNSLKINVRAYYDTQRRRVALDGQLGIKKNGDAKKNTPHRDEAWLVLLMSIRDELTKTEKRLEKEMLNEVKHHPLWKGFLENVKGVGPVTTGLILTEFDINKPRPSNFISFAGCAPGKDKKVKGEKCPYNQFLRSKLCGVLGSSFLRCKSVPYSGYYYDKKMSYEHSYREIEERLKKKDRKKKKYKGQTVRTVKWKDAYPGHLHDAAIRYMIKMFLVDLHIAWREIEGLEVSRPYAEEKLYRKHHAA